jgi:hypothetical protein
MGFLYGELKRAKQDIIEALKNVEAQYLPILSVIDEKSKGRLDSPLHLASYLLNPFYFYKDPSIEHDEVVMSGFVACVERMYDFDIQDKIVNEEIWKYLRKEDDFGKPLATIMCSKERELFDPGTFLLLYAQLLIFFTYVHFKYLI